MSTSSTPAQLSRQHDPRPSAVRFAYMAILLAAFGVRLYRLGAESLWYDETVSAYLAKQTLPELIAHTARDIHPPGYYILLHGWQWLTAAAPAYGLEFLLAWASLFPAILIVALTIAIGWRLSGVQTALIAASLAAIHPPQVWFAQEVRMYAWGACLILLTLWSVLHIFDASREQRPPRRLVWGGYVVAAVAALYTVYYALFWLVVVNLYVLGRWGPSRRSHLWRWLVAQFAVLLAYLPWLPIFMRQALDPPVPPWRAPWQDPTEALHAVVEALAALAAGHTPPFGLSWPWAICGALLLLIVIVYTKENARPGANLVLLMALGPPALLLMLTAVGLPIYHIRYVSLFAPAWPLIAGLAAVSHPRARWPSVILLGVFFFVALGGLRELWHNPAFVADDHRHAVTDLAAQWRPGDAILVNAGWAYTALDVYWPRALTSPEDSLPPNLASALRLGDQSDRARSFTSAPRLIRTGSIDAPADLGWGLPDSDFFAITATEAATALDNLARSSTRLWQYRLYDTVNDPSGILRAGLLRLGAPTFSRAYPGSGYLLLERYDLDAAWAPPDPSSPLITYAGQLALLSAEMPSQSQAGQYLYVTLTWRTENASPSHNLAASLRAMRGDQLIAQADAPIPWRPADGAGRHTLALAIPAGTPPGPLSLTLVAYDSAEMVPLRPTAHLQIEDSEFTLGKLDITLPAVAPPTPAPIARFDYIELVRVGAVAVGSADEASLVTRWTWRPRPSPYRDDYVAAASLHDAAGATLNEWRFPLGGANYPSGRWAAGYAVIQEEHLALPAGLPVGDYRLFLTVRRASDDLQLAATRRWPWPSQSGLDVAGFTIPSR